jgi:predicted secreted hydrolase
VRILRAALALVLALNLAPAHGAEPTYAQVLPGHPLTFPRDYGSHDDFRTEWWYVTGWLETESGAPLGFQVTFFRTRPGVDTANPSAFTARQLVIGHAALSDPAHGRLWTAQKIARDALGLAGASSTDTNVWIDDWRMQRAGETITTRISGDDLHLDLTLTPGQPPMLNGAGGYSAKQRCGTQSAPKSQSPTTDSANQPPCSASYYYSVPQLQVSGRIARGGAGRGTLVNVKGTAWLDHEWSTAYLDEQASGWDWIGINLADGGALMAFRIRDRAGAQHWAGGTLRDANGRVQVLGPDDLAFEPLRRWRSPRTGREYPVSFHVRAGALDFTLEPLMDDQESDSRATTGAVYWEGAVTARAGRGAASAPLDPATGGSGAVLGRGYLELTGYGEPLRLR